MNMVYIVVDFVQTLSSGEWSNSPIFLKTNHLEKVEVIDLAYDRVNILIVDNGGPMALQ